MSRDPDARPCRNRLPGAPRAAFRAALLGLALLVGSLPSARAGEPARVTVPSGLLVPDDGDSLAIDWPEGREEIRMLGLDAPEISHPQHDIPYDQPFGREAAAFVRGCLAAADRVELLRSGQKDPYGRTLGYLFVNGKNLSVLVIAAGLAIESVSRYGDNGLPEEAAACVAAAKDAGPQPFEDPHFFRIRMRKVVKARAPANGSGSDR